MGNDFHRKYLSGIVWVGDRTSPALNSTKHGISVG